MYENSHVFYVPPLMYHIYLAESLFLFLSQFFAHYVKSDYATFFFVNYFKEKLVLFVEKISGKGNVRKRTMREDEVSCRVTKFGAKTSGGEEKKKLPSKWSSLREMEFARSF